jgi:beta-lactamase regulating signal transducer with metallopeptidase domain/HEAT repeat protein
MTIVEGVGWVLLHFVWQGAIIALALAITLALIGERQARLRYALSCVALALMLATTLTTAAMVWTSGTGAPVLLTDAATAAVPAPAASTAVSSGDAGAAAATETRATSPQRATPVDGTSGRWQRVGAALPWLVTGWIAGVLLLSLRLLGGWWQTRTLRAVNVAPVPRWCEARLAMLLARMQIVRPVTMVSSIRVSVPVIVGHLKPVIVLPAAALSGLSPAHLDAILAHELAHVRRHDYLVNLAQTVIETLLFYHPAVWWVSSQVRVAREHCCDDLAVTLCRSRHEYVRALLDLEELRDVTPALALGATDGSLLARGRRLLVPQQGRTSPPRLAASVIALMVVAAAVAGASFNAALGPAALAPWDSPSGTPLILHAPSAAEASALALQAAPTGNATSVTVSPDTTGPLANRWAWATGAARTARHRMYWVGYSISPVKTLPAFVYHDRSTTIISGGMRFSGRIQSSDMSGLKIPGHPLALATAQNRAVKLLFELDASRGEPTLTSVHLSTLPLPVETNDLAVLWLGAADTAQSLERIDQFYRAAKDPDVRHDLVAAAGVHDDSTAVVAWLEQRIASQESDDLRGNAAEWIAYHPIRASVTALDRTARQDRSTHVRQEAAEALGDLPLPEAGPVLIELARTLSDTDARREAVEALGARPEAAAAEALTSIARQDKDRDIQREAVETLGDFEDKRGTNALLDLAQSHPDVEVRREAIETLGDVLPADTAVAQLKQFLADRDPAIVEEAIDTIAANETAGSRATLMELARSHSSLDIRQKAVEELAGLAAHGEGRAGSDARAIVDLLTSLATSDRALEVQIEATESLGEIGGAAATAALRDLARTHPDEEVRSEAIESLGDSDAAAAETADFLKRLVLADKSPDVQSEALETLSGLRGGAGVGALIELAREHPDPEVRKDALQQLIDSNHPDAKALFDRALKKE